MDDYDVNAYSSDEEAARPRIIRARRNYFEEYDDLDFFYRFRLRKRTVENILYQIDDLIRHPTERNECLSPRQQLLLALNFYASGSFLRIAGDFESVSKATASRTIRRVSEAIASLRPYYIHMPHNDEIGVVRRKFYGIARFPRCIGALDCTHVKIQSPGGDNAEIFRNRKQFFSLNVQSVADADLKFRDIVVRWPGSAHDSHIFRNSVLCERFERGEFGDNLIIGDSVYPVKPYFITPLLEVQNEAQAFFNESLIRTRSCKENDGLPPPRGEEEAINFFQDVDVPPLWIKNYGLIIELD
ncbi:putative nuclease HARBI1 [Coccinella septempunctata]|uniref:putative nuclease HARBI1 n=1 Tax=Coccinella septempunctata TaxID=41139 RepID=UPI001D097C8F|nr:putative nuclease HARBI1 [Coccinella septempunctata]